MDLHQIANCINHTLLKPGATTEIIKLIRNSVNTEMGIKASGGINSLKQVKELLLAGANRIGTSSGINIMNELPRN